MMSRPLAPKWCWLLQRLTKDLLALNNDFKERVGAQARGFRTAGTLRHGERPHP